MVTKLIHTLAKTSQYENVFRKASLPNDGKGRLKSKIEKENAEYGKRKH